MRVNTYGGDILPPAVMPVRQCAWCRRIADAAGVFSLPSAELVRGTHGICPDCSAQMLAQLPPRILRAA